MRPTWEREGIKLYLGDCLEVLPHLPKVDAVVTDPPYGLGERLKGGQSGEWSRGFKTAPEWDTKTVDQFISHALFLSKWQVIFGGNYYALPPARCWLLWDKMQEHTGSHAEMAWTNLDKPVRTFRMSRAEAYSLMNKEHPTQKPLTLMQWCIEQLPANTEIILDPFMGSGTTGVACVKLGRKFIGIEKEPKYFEIAVKRIERALSEERSSLFPVAKETQTELFREEVQ